MFVSGVLLGAGASNRFGSPKMLAPVGEKKKRPLLRRVLEEWLGAGFDEVIVVLGKNAEEIRGKIGDFSYAAAADAAADSRKSVGRKPPVLVENRRWRSGMFSSVKAGLAATDPRSTHVALSPADLPFLSKKSLRAVLSAAASLDANGSSLVVPTHAGRRGHPLLIPAALRARVLSWPDSARLNQLFDEPDVTVHYLDGFDETILRDVDTPDDLSR
ncbi:MAG TPA: nucleotidyltransferase family protein [Thermoanaerobaculia bacterium]|nr:nucleotidyltransferase family protein [Thermoanaerobaculia bacterium]